MRASAACPSISAISHGADTELTVSSPSRLVTTAVSLRYASSIGTPGVYSSRGTTRSAASTSGRIVSPLAAWSATSWSTIASRRSSLLIVSTLMCASLSCSSGPPPLRTARTFRYPPRTNTASDARGLFPCWAGRRPNSPGAQPARRRKAARVRSSRSQREVRAVPATSGPGFLGSGEKLRYRVTRINSPRVGRCRGPLSGGRRAVMSTTQRRSDRVEHPRHGISTRSDRPQRLSGADYDRRADSLWSSSRITFQRKG